MRVVGEDKLEFKPKVLESVFDLNQDTSTGDQRGLKKKKKKITSDAPCHVEKNKGGGFCGHSDMF